MAEQSRNSHELTTDFTDDEIEVAIILFRLPRLIGDRELRFKWGSKKMRSAAKYSNQASPAVIPPLSEPASSPPENPVDERHTGKDKASSPATPLSFSPSESDEKRRPSKRKLQKKREEWLEIIRDLTERKELLKKEVENVSCYYDKLKAFNFELKARKEELITRGLKKETLHPKTGQSLNQVMKLGQTTVHHTPFATDQAVQGMERSQNSPFWASSHIIPSSSFNTSNSLSPLCLPDLNVSAEDSDAKECFQPFHFSMANENLSKVMASEARRRRLEIYRGKASVAANKRYPC